jgi:DNA adenine methylase
MDDISAPALLYHGSKFRLASWCLSYFPSHRTYVEPFGGAAGVLLQKPRAYAEVYNDLDGDVVNFFRVVRDPDLRRQLVENLVMTPYAREEFVAAYETVDDPVERARRLCVRAQMGFGSAGATKPHTGFRSDTARDYGTAQSAWAKYPDRLAAIGRRFVDVLIECRPALDVVKMHDRPDTLSFLDPPYIHSTMQMGSSKKGYRLEMTVDDHAELVDVALGLKGFVALCGYPNPIYDRLVASSWKTVSTPARISAGRGTAVRTEVMWLNPACQAALTVPELLL